MARELWVPIVVKLVANYYLDLRLNLPLPTSEGDCSCSVIQLSLAIILWVGRCSEYRQFLVVVPYSSLS